ncbi:electron transport complex subunit RsxG [Thiohalomonas denitrificans]|uniref:electron transport complex subunit RsxG n=1 Tax=Thiohalomonas denitrificans TaxID=415747 RepID=UPI0026EDA1F7|nr:electron transport complex subunit RsxG [Thiohalomonas denitrificans]
MPLKNMLLGAFLLGVFAIAGTGLVALTHSVTVERIAQNEREALLSLLHQLVPPKRHDNDLFEDVTYVTDPRLGTSRPVPVYRARRDGEPVAAVLAPVAPEGYGGNIRLLVAINIDGTLAGVRVLGHQETPGLGDKIEAERSDWILQFDRCSLEQPRPSNWAVKKDGGVFDQFTGATITPRAVVNAVHDTLIYFQNNREMLFERNSAAEADEQEEDEEHG